MLPAIVLELVDTGASTYRRIHSYKDVRVSVGVTSISLGRGEGTQGVWLLEFDQSEALMMRVSLLLFSTASAPQKNTRTPYRTLLHLTLNHGLKHQRYPPTKYDGIFTFPENATTTGLEKLLEQGVYQLHGWVETPVYSGTHTSTIIVIFGFAHETGGGWCRILPEGFSWVNSGRAFENMNEKKLEVCKRYLATLESEQPSSVSQVRMEIGKVLCRLQAEVVYEDFLHRYPFLHLKLS